MDKTRIFFTMTACAMLIIEGCQDSGSTSSSPQAEDDLLENNSFEVGGSPSLAGWLQYTNDISKVRPSDDVPPGGGNSSVSLANIWSSPGAIWQNLVAPSGTHRYELTVWAKASPTSFPFLSGGYLDILVKSSGGTWTRRKELHFSDSTWTWRQLSDTLTTSPADTIRIWLQGNFGQSSRGYVLFDLCKFVKLD